VFKFYVNTENLGKQRGTINLEFL